jgi:methionine biosynthesis protein MetW
LSLTRDGGTPLDVHNFIEKGVAAREIPFLTSALASVPKTSRVLDVGCGAGSVMRFYRDLGYQDIHGVELEGQLAEVARRDLGLDVTERSGEDLGCFADASFDVVYSNHALEHMQRPEDSLREMYRVLKSGGIAILGVPNGRHLDDTITQFVQRVRYGRSDHIQQFSYDSFVALVEGAGFTVLRRSDNRGSLTLLLDERLPARWFFANVAYPLAQLLYNGVRSFDVVATKA